jgi:hypothetical protein
MEGLDGNAIQEYGKYPELDWLIELLKMQPE